MLDVINPGFVFTIEVVKDGKVVETETVHNLMPYEGMKHMLDVTLKGSTPVTTWYVGIYESNYTPVLGDTMSAFPAAAGESTAYDEGTRVAYVPGTVTNGVVNNSASKAEFTMNAVKTIYGGFLSSASGKSGTTGTLLSAVKFGTAKSVDSGTVIRVTAGFTMTST